MLQAAETRLAEAAAAIAGQGVDVATFLHPGTPSQVILDRADRMLAAGDRHRHPRADRPAPSAAGEHRPAGGARRPLPGADGPPRRPRQAPGDPHHPGAHRLLGGRRAGRAAAHRLLASFEHDARLILFHAFNLPIEYTAYGPIPTSVRYLADAGLEAERLLFEAARGAAAGRAQRGDGRPRGGPGHAIAEEAEKRGADLIAMGTRGRSGLRHLLMGSTAERVVEYAPCPVMTIRRTE